MALQSRDCELLAASGWLAETPVRFRDALLERCMTKRYERGEVVYRAGDPAGGLYGLVAGGIGVVLSPEHREPYIGTFARPGFWIGEGSVLTRAPRLIGIQALRESRLAHLSLSQWDALVESEPDAWRWFAHLVARNERLALAVADALMTRDSGQRLAAILLILSMHGAPAPADGSVEIEASQDDLARLANLSRSSTGRILQRLEAAGIIRNAYRQVRLIDRDGLRAHGFRKLSA